MGAWGTGTFENDDASDWVYELEESGLDAVREALALGQAGGYLDAPDGCMVLAAAEVVAAAAGQPAAVLPEEVTAFVATAPQVDAALVAQAFAAVARVLDEQSELRDLWQDSDHHAAWSALMADLQSRLAAVAAPAS